MAPGFPQQRPVSPIQTLQFGTPESIDHGSARTVDWVDLGICVQVYACLSQALPFAGPDGVMEGELKVRAVQRDLDGSGCRN